MRPRILARPAAAGALCSAILGTGAVGAAAQSGSVPAVPPSPAVPAVPPAPAAPAAAVAPTPVPVAVRPRVRVTGRALSVRAGARAAVRGTIRPRVRGIGVVLQVRREGRWKTLDRDRTGARGRYRLRRHVRVTGSTRARLRVTGGPGVRPAIRRLGRLEVFRVAYASWYGPGLYGNQLGCGGTLWAGRLGVAHKWLPCGTMVSFRHGGRTVRVPVIDRGPYVGGREYDLTAATAQRLGFSGHGGILATR